MKIWIATAITAILIYGCDDSYPKIEKPTCCGKATAFFNGNNWEAVMIGTHLPNALPGSYFLQMSVYDDNILKTMEVSLGNLYPGEGVHIPHKLKSNTDTTFSANLFYVDEDIVLGSYFLIDSLSSNRFVVESYDSVTRQMKGTFQFSFLKNHKPYQSAPDTIRMTNGVFEVTLDN